MFKREAEVNLPWKLALLQSDCENSLRDIRFADFLYKKAKNLPTVDTRVHRFRAAVFRPPPRTRMSKFLSGQVSRRHLFGY